MHPVRGDTRQGQANFPTELATSRHECIDKAREQRGHAGASITKWRQLCKDPGTYAVNKTNQFLRWCKQQNHHPAAVPTGRLCTFLGTEGGGQAKLYMSAITSLVRLAHDTRPYDDDDDLKIERRQQSKERATRRQPIPRADWRELIRAIFEAIKSNEIQGVPTGTLLDCLATRIKIDGGFRLTGLARMPWYEVEREPADVPPDACHTIYISAVDTKEMTLRWSEGWCDPIKMSQDLNDNDETHQTTRLGVLWAEWERRIHHLRPQRTFKRYGREVFARSMWIERTRVTKEGKDVWKFDPTKLPTENTLPKRVQRVIADAGLKPQKVLPRHLRHWFASIFKLGRIDHGAGTWDQLRQLMRHRDIETTKRYYMLNSPAPEVQERWRQHDTSKTGWSVSVGRIACI